MTTQCQNRYKDVLRAIFYQWPKLYYLCSEQFFLTVGQNNFGNKIPKINIRDHLLIQLFSRQEQRPEEYVLAMSMGDNIIQLGVSEP